jgi:hypothetical protein
MTENCFEKSKRTLAWFLVKQNMKGTIVMMILLLLYFVLSMLENTVVFHLINFSPRFTYHEVVMEEPANLLLTPFIALTKIMRASSSLSIPLFYIFSKHVCISLHLFKTY